MKSIQLFQKFLNNRINRMFLVRDFSKQNFRKDQPVHATLRSCTSEKRLFACGTPDDYIRVGSYKYRQNEMLGKGYSSKVYKATHINNTEDRYAIKVINLKKFKSSNIAMLETQIEVHRTLSHPNIVQFYDAYKTENFYYIVTEFCPHGDLMQFLNQRKQIEESKAQNIIQQIIQGYVYLNKKSIIHRDLKPANILRNGQTWKIGDFGFSVFNRSETFYDKINVGTPLYMPLESLKTNKYSSKSDIFSLGIILYEILTGRTPWECRTEKQLMNKMKNEKIRIPEIKSQDLKKFIIQACEIDEEERMSITELSRFFTRNRNNSSTNPEQKENEKRALKNVLSLKSIKQSYKVPLAEVSKNQKNTGISLCSKQILNTPHDPSTEPSQKSDSNRISQKQGSWEKNNKLLLQQLQFCRLIYYLTKNMKSVNCIQAKSKSFLTLTLFKYLLRTVKLLEDPNHNYGDQLINFDAYKNDKEYKKLAEQIRSYSRRYQKEYLDILKNTQISVIRLVNKKFAELSYNSPLHQGFYKNFYKYLTELVRSINHQIMSSLSQKDKQTLGFELLFLESLYVYTMGIQQKLKACESRKNQFAINFTQKVVMDYRNSRLEKKDYQQLRAKIKRL